MIKTISIRELRPNMAAVMSNIREKFDRYIINRNGCPEAIMMSIDDYESLLETLEIQSNKDLMLRVKKAKKEIRQGKTTSLDTLHKELGLV